MWASICYRPPISSVIHEWKHLGKPGLGVVLANIMLHRAPDWLDNEQFDAVLAVPLSRERRLFRGFNQSEELAQRLCRHYGWTLLPRHTVSRADTPPQSTLKSTERLRNVRNIFQIQKPLPDNCNLLLIDDVFTTGATLSELAQILKKSGARRICCWTLARA